MNTEMKILSALVAGGAAAAAVGLVRSGYERRHFVVEETSIYSEKIRGFCHRKRQIPGPLSARYSKIAQRVFLLFSDFQILIFDFFGSFNLLKI